MELVGIGNLGASLKAKIAKLKHDVEAERRRAAEIIVQRLMENIPVWSGRTIESIRVNNDGSYAPLQGSPSKDERARFGATSKMSLGSEPMRAEAERQAWQQVKDANYDLRMPLHITIHSEAWGLVEKAEAPNKGQARNKAIVSEIAKQAAIVAVKSLKG